MTELTAAKGAVNAEAVLLAGEMARVVGEMVAALEKHRNLTREQALDRIHEDDPVTIDRIRAAPPSQLTFFDLHTLGRHSPEVDECPREVADVAGSDPRASWP